MIGEDGEQLGIMSSREAQVIAEEAGLDLVKISPKAVPPVCKVIDYGKYRYEVARKEKEQKNLLGDGPKIKPMDIATLTRQIATMLSAGVPLVQSIELLAQSHDKIAMRKMLAKMCEDVSSGTPFNQALRKHPSR